MSKPKISDTQIDAIARAAGVKAMGIKLPEGVAPPIKGGLSNKKGGNARTLPDYCMLQPGPGGRQWSVLIPDWLPTRLNQLINTHHCKASRMKRADAVKMGRALREAGVPKATTKRRVGLEIILGPRMKGGDPDAYWKTVKDGLKHVGALVDDTRQWAEATEPAYSRAPRMATRIILEDI